MPSSATPDSTRRLLKKRQVDLQELLERWSAIIEQAVEGLTNELTRGHGHKNEGISRDDVTKIRELSTAMRAAADTKIQLAKAAKLLADSMSADEVLAAAIERVMAEPRRRRADLLSEMVRRHRDEVFLEGGTSALKAPDTAIDLIKGVRLPEENKDGSHSA